MKYIIIEMPEVMEIRKYADFINLLLKNQKLNDIKITGGRYKKHKAFEKYDLLKKNLPLKLISVKTKGKFIYIEFEKNLYILNTLGLSGGWAFQKNNAKQFQMPQLLEYIDETKVEVYLLRSMDHINVEFIFDIGKLVFFDMLSFGTLKVINETKDLEKKLNTLGPDIMDENTTLDIFETRIKSNSNIDKAIGVVITNQKLISGVGNYIRADALWLAKINPFRKVKDLNENEIKKLFHSLKVITWGNYNRKYAISHKIINKSDKIPYDYNRDFYVYREEKDIYNNPVVKEELYEGSQKRFIYWVKEHQV
jgi:formamidopyrimidine-DNA glycosylase